MKINKNINGFTIIELLVAIAIVVTIVIGSNNISFKYVSDKQNLEIFTNKVISEIERIRNNSLIGKGIGTNLDVPEKWKIEFNSGWNGTSSGNIVSSYYDGTSWINENNLKMDKLIEIKKVKCIDVNGVISSLTSSQTGAILFEGGKYSLTGSVFCPSNYSNIEIETMSKLFTGSINFDIVTGLIKR
ncbi:MAG: prepilin-type N-terminal cleavage/methylation domain-containing protein [Candidatus Gracilibacteria bacterium]|nr:prepilin-type N-terminal cleavage/methylation domain-containing protein [Candidatus Gracilibacteria bacterium]